MFSCEPMLTGLTATVTRGSARAYSSSVSDGAVVGGVVADHELEVGEVLGEDRLDAAPDPHAARCARPSQSTTAGRVSLLP